MCLLSSQPRESVAAVIDLYSDLPLDLREEAEMYIEEASGSEELERVRLNASLRGKGNCYELLAQTLESRLASA